MRISKSLNKRRLLIAFAGGVLCCFFYKLYVYISDRRQFEDSNLLISLVFTLIASACMYLFLSLVSIFTSSKK